MAYFVAATLVSSYDPRMYIINCLNACDSSKCSSKFLTVATTDFVHVVYPMLCAMDQRMIF